MLRSGNVTPEGQLGQRLFSFRGTRGAQVEIQTEYVDVRLNQSRTQ